METLIEADIWKVKKQLFSALSPTSSTMPQQKILMIFHACDSLKVIPVGRTLKPC